MMKKLIAIGIACALSGPFAVTSAQETMKKEGAMKPAMGMKDGMAMKDGMPMKDSMGMKDSMPMMNGTMMDMMKMADSNGDGMISKREFMKHHEAMFAGMKKTSNGMVSLKDMEAMHGSMPMKK